MKHLIRNILVGCTVLIASSCSDDFLDLTPEDAISNENFLATVEDFQSAIVGGYSQMALADWYGRYMLLIPDIMGNDIKANASANRGAAWALYTGGPTTDQNENREFWQELYEAINIANAMINADYTPPTSQQAEFNQVLGEAYAIRAIAHFDLVRLFGQPYTLNNGASAGVPVVTEFDQNSLPSRNTVAEVYAQVISDFQQAINLMTIAPGTATTFSREAAQGLLARVYLYQGDWANAEAQATAVVNSGRFALTAFADYPTMFLDGNSSEAMLEMSMTLADNRGADHIGGMYKETGYGDYLPSQDLLSLFSATDVRGTLFLFDTNLDNTIFASADGLGRRVDKWPSAGAAIATDNISVIRYSEVLLIRAEARARAGGNDAGAIADLDAIRFRSDPSATATALSGQALIDEIMLERRRELYAEGHQIFDLSRTGSDMVRTDCSTPGACTFTFPNDRFILAIPQVELDTNPQMVQNPSYGT